MKEKDPTTEEEKIKVNYRKVFYHVYSQRNEVSITLQFSLTSTETGAIRLTDLVRSQHAEEIEYARFDGPVTKLVPGF